MYSHTCLNVSFPERIVVRIFCHLSKTLFGLSSVRHRVAADGRPLSVLFRASTASRFVNTFDVVEFIVLSVIRLT